MGIKISDQLGIQKVCTSEYWLGFQMAMIILAAVSFKPFENQKYGSEIKHR